GLARVMSTVGEIGGHESRQARMPAPPGRQECLPHQAGKNARPTRQARMPAPPLGGGAAGVNGKDVRANGNIVIRAEAHRGASGETRIEGAQDGSRGDRESDGNRESDEARDDGEIRDSEATRGGAAGLPGGCQGTSAPSEPLDYESRELGQSANDFAAASVNLLCVILLGLTLAGEIILAWLILTGASLRPD